MDFFSKLGSLAKTGLYAAFPSLAIVDAAKELISEAVAQKIRDAACAKAQTLITEAHHSVMKTIVWQNGLLLLSLLPVYLLRSSWPFYVAYVCVAGYTAYSVFQSRALLVRLAATRSVTKTIAVEVRDAIEVELTQREFYERKAVQWLGPDLQKLSDEVAHKLKPDIIAAAANIAFTLFMAFIAFRVFAIPLLEARALGH